jgi:hypothetical protein
MISREDKVDLEKTFDGLSPTRFWRLLYDANRQEAEGPLGFDDSKDNPEYGYMRSMFNAFNFMLETISDPITAEYFDRLRQKAIEFNLYFHPGLIKSSFEQDRSQGSSFGIGTLPGIGPNISLDGLRGLIAKWKAGDDYIHIVKSGYGGDKSETYNVKNIPSDDKIEPLIKRILSERGWRIVLPVTDMKLVKARINTIIDDYQRKILLAENERDKIRLIAICIQELEVTHPFPDGNCRTFCLLALNKLLIQNGLTPSLIENPNQFDAYSIEELCDQIILGQQAFRAQKKMGDDKVIVQCIYLENNPAIARLVAMEVIKDCKNWDKISDKEKSKILQLLTKTLSNFSGKIPIEKIIEMIPPKDKFLEWGFSEMNRVGEELMRSGALNSVQMRSVVKALKKEIENSIHVKSSWFPSIFDSASEFHITCNPKKLEKLMKKAYSTPAAKISGFNKY